ncbi:MAG TPA: FtsX-like permease family protein [Solirubrobacteraceae bacterium]|nr:FtsX-like permease family protein [Solirubrobacteraceae bacterium]
MDIGAPERAGGADAPRRLLQELPPEARRFIRPYGLFYLYRSRLRYHLSQELFAGLGIVIAVALVFATLVASGSIAGSAAQVLRKVVGHADLQLRARGPEGFPEGLLAEVERLPGVKQAAPLLEEQATVRSADGRQLTVTVLGTDVALGILDGLSHTVPGAVFSERAIGLSSASASALGISRASLEGPGGAHVRFAVRGRAYPLKVSAVLGPEAVGALSGVLAGAMPLEALQGLSGLRGRVSRILVQSYPGRGAQVRRGLERIAGGRISVASADQEIALLDQALAPGDLASTFFAAVAALLGFLLAFNAVLLTVPDRRAQIADLRLDGARRSAMVELLLFQGLCLGLIASLVGLGAGYGLALGVFHQRPGYLSQAFVLGEGLVIGAGPPLLALVGGVLATCIASMLPAADLRRARATDAIFREEGEAGNGVTPRIAVRLACAAALLLGIATAIYIADPALALVACVAVALACVAAMPLLFIGMVGAAGWVAAHSSRLSILPVAVMSLRRTNLRSLALVMTGAVALFGAVALEGSRGDLLAGITRTAQASAAAGEVWVLNPHDELLMTDFQPGNDEARIARVPGVSMVRALQGGFFDIGNQRALTFAFPQRVRAELLASQIVAGGLRSAERHLDQGGWIAISAQLAATLHASVGAAIRLPTASGIRQFDVAALTTNLGWPGGSILTNRRTAVALLGTVEPTVLAAQLADGASPGRVQREVRATLGAGGGLEVTSARAWINGFLSLTGEGLSQLQWISLLLVIGSIMAMAAALSADVWQERPSLSALRIECVPAHRLRRILVVKAALTLGAGCTAGVIGGIYGEAILDAYLRHVTGFPVSSFAFGAGPIEIFAIVIGAASLIAMVPIWLASRVPLAVALEQG